MNVAKILPYLFGIIVLVIIGGGAYYVGNKVGYEKAITEVSKESYKLAKVARDKEVKINAFNQQKVAKLVESNKEQVTKMSRLQKRLKLLQTKRADKVTGSVCDGTDSVDADVVSVFQSAIDSRYLSKNINIAFIVGETYTVEGYCLYSIEEYNRIASQLVTLIDVTNGLDCVVN